MIFDQSVYRMATVAYADIFDYPLTAQELRLWGIKKRIPSSHQLTDRYFFLKGHSGLVKLRKKRYEASVPKWKIARAVGWWLRLVPTIQLVGVTGGLAMDNANPPDDIDLFIITKKNTLFITRLFATFIVDVLGKRRKPAETAVADKVCLNMFMSESALTIPKGEQDLFSAHEVLQMRPLWWRGSAYEIFLQKNLWVKHFLPIAWEEKARGKESKFMVHSSLFIVFEPLAKLAQLWYMKNRRTTEVVSDSVLRFHPKDARVWVREELRKRLDAMNIPLDKIFYRE